MRVGCDIIEISRIKNFVDRHSERLIGHVFTQREWDYCQSRSNIYASFAARFAAKEAVSKALGVGFGERLSWISVEVINNEIGAPGIILDAKGEQLLKQLSAKYVHISLSHSHDNALAVAIVE